MTIMQMIEKMTRYPGSTGHDLDHLLRVWAYARLIGEMEKLDEGTQFVLETAAVVHDIACPLCRGKYGSAPGNLQEKEGPALAEAFLENSGMSPAQIGRVAWLVGHHHTMDPICGMDHQILIEADYIVNALENGYSQENICRFVHAVMRTSGGIRTAKTVFSLQD